MAVTFEGGRFADTNRSWQAAEETPKTGWVKTDLGIFALAMGSGNHNGDNVALELRWRNKTDSPAGAFNVLGASGEVKYASVTALTDEGTLATGNFGTSSASTAVAGVTGEQEKSGIATSTTYIDKTYFTELQCGISFADG